MMKLTSREMFHTSLGLKIVIDNPKATIHKNDIVEVDNKLYCVEGIDFSKAHTESIILSVTETKA